MKYINEDYHTLVSQSYGYSKSEYENSIGFVVSKAIYDKNYINGSGEDKIPRKIHQVWIGGNLPDRFKRFADSWSRYHPDWDYKLWGDKDAEEFGMIRKGLFDQADNNAQKSDIFRYEILRKYGGLYIDTDFECLRPFDDLIYLDFFTSSGHSNKYELYIGLIASIPHHPIIERCINDMTHIDYRGDFRRMFETTGAYFYTRCFLKEVNAETNGVVAFPPPFFYPWPNNDMGSKTPYNYVRPFSYAIHHWAVSWIKK